MKKITIISGYYFPEDTAIGLYNTQMVAYLQDKGYDVKVITGFPNYPQWRIRDSYKNKKTFLRDTYGTVQVYRYKQYVPSNPTFFKRILLILDFTFGSFFNVMKIKECDLVINVVPYTSTIFLGWILKLRTKARIWNHVQDFEFDAAKEAGIYSKNGWLKNGLFKVLFGIERRFLKKGQVNSTISYKMLETLENKCPSTETFHFPNWIDPRNVDPSSGKRHDYMKSARFKVLYSGNIGEKQDWEFFLKFASRLRDDNIEIVVVGDGAKKEWLVNEIESFENVKYYPPIDYEDLSSLLCSADLHILFQKPDVVDSVMPSKLLGMMASARPSLITGNADSEVKTIIDESKGGNYVVDKDLDACIAMVRMLMDSPSESAEIGSNARTYIINKFSSEKVLSNFENRISRLLGPKG